MKKPLVLAVLCLALGPTTVAASAGENPEARVIVNRMVQHHFDRADRNNDSNLSKAEMLAYAARLFQESDLDGNNVVTPEELTIIKQEKYKIIMGEIEDRK